MTKIQFLDELRKRLSFLPEEEAEEKVSFFSEMIDDKIEEGIDEEAAIDEICSSNDYVFLPSLDATIDDERKPKKRKINSKTLIFLISGFPIWLPLLIALIAVECSIIVSMWSVVVSFYAVCLATALAAPVGLLAGVLSLFSDGIAGLTLISLSLCSAGISLFVLIASLFLSKLCVKITVGVYKMNVRFFK